MARQDTALEALIMKHRRKKEPIPAETIVAFAAQITGALAYLHSARGTGANGDPYQGIVHRDLKPANILVSEDGNRLVLADFGLCKSAMASGTTRAGSPTYMAPETLLEGKITPASDIWALGVILYELAALRKPSFAKAENVESVFVDGWKPDLHAVKDSFIKDLLDKVLVLNPEERPSASQLLQLLGSERENPISPPIVDSPAFSLNGFRSEVITALRTLHGVADMVELIFSHNSTEALASSNTRIGDGHACLNNAIVETQPLGSSSLYRDSVKEITTLREDLFRKTRRIEALNERLVNTSTDRRQALSMDDHPAFQLEAQIAALQENMDALKAGTAGYLTHIEELRDELHALRDQLAAKTVEAEEAAELRQFVRQLEEDLYETKQLVCERNDAIDDLTRKITELNNDLKDKDTEIAELCEQLEAQPIATTIFPESSDAVDIAALREVQDENAALKDELEAKQSLVDELQEEIESLKQQCDSLKDDMIKLDNANNDKLAALQCSLDESRKQIADLQEEVEVLKNTANDIDPAVVESLQEELRKLQEELDDRENTITELQGLLDEQEGSNADLGAKIDALTRELEEARDARPQSGNDERINALEAEITSLQELLDKANEDLAQKTDECGKAIGEAGNLRKAVEYYKKLVDDIRAGIVVLDDNLSALDLQ
ncbi:Coiled-coil protein [Giardia duodenalis ATCC 50581]|uniref:non-specific serine/threonine protein kinase n=1 Tax=Giardia intestinalis (strain ATCC 50581 / GS clone H7) TaxID=598745 RepID=C6LNW0_GIAIB|nr:Coiled-coil protein [Giardia intestinalis ATCC 50581]